MHAWMQCMLARACNFCHIPYNGLILKGKFSKNSPKNYFQKFNFRNLAISSVCAAKNIFGALVDITLLTSLLLASFIAADSIYLDKSPLGSGSLPEIGLKYRCKAITQHNNTHVVTQESEKKRLW